MSTKQNKKPLIINEADLGRQGFFGSSNLGRIPFMFTKLFCFHFSNSSPRSENIK